MLLVSSTSTRCLTVRVVYLLFVRQLAHLPTRSAFSALIENEFMRIDVRTMISLIVANTHNSPAAL